MSGGKDLSSAAIGVYATARRMGLLNTRLGQGLFSAAYFAYKRLWEDSLLGLARRRPELFRGGHALDVGANIGYTARVLAGAVEEGYRVFAFEPEPFNFQLLGRAARSKGSRGRVTPIQAAVGAECGEIELWLNEQHHGDHRVMTEEARRSGLQGPSVRVPMVSVDGFLDAQRITGPVRFIKIDVQGYEIAVCRGMERTIDRDREAVLTLEYMPEALSSLGFRPQDLLDWLAKWGFRTYWLEHDGNLSADARSPVLDKRGYADLVASRVPL